MSVNYENTYWGNKGKYPAQQEALQKLIPDAGTAPYPDKNPALETFRIASNCYYDLYNNGLCNREKEFIKVFGFDGFWYGERVELTQELIDRTEIRMDEIILAAYTEQFPPKEEAYLRKQAAKNIGAEEGELRIFEIPLNPAYEGPLPATPQPVDWAGVREMVASGMVTLGGKFALQILDDRKKFEQALNFISHLWPEPESCGDMGVYGINDGKARLVTAHGAINVAREALGMYLHPFPGEK